MRNKELRTVDVFAGCGGMSLGFQNAGYNIVAAYDNWEPAINVYNDNFKRHSCTSADLSLESWHEQIRTLAPDVIIGGPPCQDFSHAGKRDENGGKGILTNSFAQIILKATPKWFVMENVDRTIRSNIFKEVLFLFQKAGYGLTAVVLDASFYGVPQKRKRLFLIGGLKQQDNFLNERIIIGKAKRPMTLRNYFGDYLGVGYYYRHPRNYNRRGVFSIDEPSPTIRGVNRPLPSGYKPHPNDATSNLADIRPLTTDERALIQTFPPNFKFSGSKTNLEQMIGNAVPVKLAEHVAKTLLAHINGIAIEKSFPKQLNYSDDKQQRLFA